MNNLKELKVSHFVTAGRDVVLRNYQKRPLAILIRSNCQVTSTTKIKCYFDVGDDSDSSNSLQSSRRAPARKLTKGERIAF